MRAWVAEPMAPRRSGRSIKLVDREVPRPGDGELLIRVHVCGVCRTDLHVIDGDLPVHAREVVPGHEVVGEVIDLGPGVDNGWSGQRVGVAWLRHTCGTCRWCRSGRERSAALATSMLSRGARSATTVSAKRRTSSGSSASGPPEMAAGWAYTHA